MNPLSLSLYIYIPNAILSIRLNVRIRLRVYLEHDDSFPTFLFCLSSLRFPLAFIRPAKLPGYLIWSIGDYRYFVFQS